MSSGIYALYWWDQDLIYVGLSQTLESRKLEHLSMLRRNKHTNYKVQNAYNLYGVPEFIVLELCTIEYLPTLEKYWCYELDGLRDRGLCLVEPGVVGFGSSSNSSKYSKIQILKVFRLLSSTSLSNTAIGSKVGVPGHVATDIRRGATHLWLREVYPKKYANMHKIYINLSNTYNTRYNYPDLVSPEGIVYTNIINITEFCKSISVFNTNMHASTVGLSKLKLGIKPSYKGWTLHNGRTQTTASNVKPSIRY